MNELMKHDDTANDTVFARRNHYYSSLKQINRKQHMPFPVITEYNGIMGNNIKLSYGGIIIICDSDGYYNYMNTVIHERHAVRIDVIAFILRNA